MRSLYNEWESVATARAEGCEGDCKFHFGGMKVVRRPPGGWLASADLDDRKRIGRPSAYRTSRPAVD